MTEAQKGYLLRTGLFAILYDGLMMLLGWLLIHPATMGAIHTFKATFTIGLPSLQQLLDMRHQVGSVSGATPGIAIMWLTISTVLYCWTNGYYISLLARSVRVLPGRASNDAGRSFWPLLFWVLVQMLLTVITVPLLLMGQMIGGAIATLLLLWFRFYFMFMEYTIVALGSKLRTAWQLSVQIRRQNVGTAWAYFLGILVFNVVMTYVANIVFFVPAVVVFLLINSLTMTWVQHRLLQHFFTAADTVNVSR